MTIFFDCTYTRTQQGSVGITRVVRNLSKQLATRLASSEKLMLVVAGGDSFRIFDSVVAQAPASASGTPHRESAPTAIDLFNNLVSSPRLRAIMLSLPLALQLRLWRLYWHLIFSHLARRLPPAPMRPGDLVILCDASWTYDVWRCARRAAIQGAKIVTLVYDLIPIDFPQFCAPLFTAVFRRWIKDAVAVSDGIICISATTKQNVERYCREVAGRMVPLDHFRLGDDLDLCDTEGAVRDDIRRLCAGHGAAKLFIAVGSIEPRRNHLFLLDAFENVWAAEPDALLVIVGRASGDAGPTLARLSSHPLLGQRLFVFHDGSDTELDYLYRHARALLIPSAVEGFGLPLVEARRRGCLVLASDIPVFRELADAWVKLFSLDDPKHMARAVLDVVATPPQRPSAMPAYGWRASADEFLTKAAVLAGRRS